MFKTYFSTGQLFPLIPGVLLVLISIFMFLRNDNKRLAFYFLFAGAFFVNLFAILLDPYINLWDEQVHALIAKNMIQDPFKPMFYKEVYLSYSIENWIGNHIWVHKQPLFLWQIALSMKIFGINEFALRFPTLIMSTLMIPLIFRIGKLAVNQNVGYFGALLYLFSSHTLNTVSGYYHTEHNDIAFIFYVASSFWAWLEFDNSGKKRWIVLIGIFAGAAVLVKWLTGVLVFSAWFMSIIFDKEKRFSIKVYIPLIYSGLIAILVFLPWQLYIFYRFPVEAAYNFALNSKHFTEVIAPHGGDAWYHFDKIKFLYGNPVFYLFIPALIMFVIKSQKIQNGLGILTSVILVYLFFTLAKTKMPNFTLITGFVVFLSLGVLIDTLVFLLQKLFAKIKYKTLIVNTIVFVLFTGISVANFDAERLQEYHTKWKTKTNDYVQRRTNHSEYYRNLESKLGLKQCLIFNPPQFEHIMIMFYSPYIAYDRLPTEEEYKMLKTKNLNIAVFERDSIPEFLKTDSTVLKLKFD